MPRWLKFTGIGCLGLLALIVLLSASAYVMVRISGDRSIATGEAVDREHPDAHAYTPAADGGLTPDRLERFLDVRETLAPFCGRMTTAAIDFSRMDELEKSDKEPGAGQFFSLTGRVVGSAFFVARDISRYITLRNESLLAVRMGLGEYTWLYSLIYHSWQERRPTSFMFARDDEPAVFTDRVLPQLREMVARRAAMEGAGSFWRDEAAALRADPRRRPFADGLPPAMAAALEPYRDRLTELYCAETDELDVTRVEREGLGYEHR